MKAQILKIAGVKSEKEFYKKFPTEEAFMEAHGKELEKAQGGVMMPQTPYKIPQLQLPTFGGNQQAPNVNIPYTPGYTPAPQLINPQSVGGMQNIMSWNYNQPLQTINPNSPNATMKRDREEFESYSNILDADYKSKAAKQKGEEDKVGKAAKIIAPGVGDIVQGIQQLKAEKRLLRESEQGKQVSDVALQASRTRPEQVQRRYLRPEDQRLTGEELFPIYGVGTNVLTAKDGAEITNTYAPDTLYDDLELDKAQSGDVLSSLANAGVGDSATSLIKTISGPNAGGNIGGAIGGTIGQFFGPAGKMIGQVGGQLIGSVLDKNPQNIKKAQNATMSNVQAMALQNMIGGQAQNSSFMKNGGMVDSDYEWVSHTWQPQTITQFGEHKLSDLLKPDETMDTLRAGGHLKDYTPPSEEAMYTGKMAMGGELQTHWGGYAEPMSYNPHIPGGGETVMFRGQSHDESDGKGRTGIGVTYGQNPVEVERGEPAIKMKDGGKTGGDSLVVFGNLKIPHKLLGDKDAKGKNFKNYVADISKQEEKLNNIIDKNSNTLMSLDDDSPFGKLAFNSAKANIYGANEKLKTAAEKKMNAAALQSAMNDTIEEYGLKTSDKGIISAKQGIKIAQDGSKLPNVTDEVYYELKDLYEKAQKEGTGKSVLKFQKRYHQLVPEYAKSVLSKYPVTSYGKKQGLTTKDLKSNEDEIFDKRTIQYMTALENNRWKPLKGETISTPRNLPTITPPQILTKGPVETTTSTIETEKKRFPWQTYFNQALEYLRPSNKEQLDPTQLYGEMYALANNQVEPVKAQTFQPELGVPYDISLQDILNENQAAFRSQQRIAGYNPAVQAMMNASKYQANQKVLGEQFRMNQAMKDKVYNENRGILNQAKLQNLGILDQQFARTEEAKSKTKATNLAALSSIGDKYLKNKLENRTLQTYENLYKYRFDPNFRAVNMNPLVDFDEQLALTPVRDEDGRVVEYRTTTKTDKFGNPTGGYRTVTEKPSKKTAKNGSIVKALKNI